MSLPSAFRKVNWQPMMSKYPTQSLMPIPAAMGQLLRQLVAMVLFSLVNQLYLGRRIYPITKLKQRIIRIIYIYSVYIYIHTNVKTHIYIYLLFIYTHSVNIRSTLFGYDDQFDGQEIVWFDVMFKSDDYYLVNLVHHYFPKYFGIISSPPLAIKLWPSCARAPRCHVPLAVHSSNILKLSMYDMYIYILHYTLYSVYIYSISYTM